MVITPLEIFHFLRRHHSKTEHVLNTCRSKIRLDHVTLVRASGKNPLEKYERKNPALHVLFMQIVKF